MKNPYKSTIFWSWNKQMSDREMEWQIAEMAKQGIGGFFIHARAGLTIPYMGEEWFKAVETSIRAAEKYGLDVWLYDEDGWPSGFAGGRVPALGEKFWAKSLRVTFDESEAPAGRIVGRYHKNAAGDYRLSPDGEMIVYYAVNDHYVDLMDAQVTQAFIDCTHEVYKARFGRHFGKTVCGIFTDEPQMEGAFPAYSFTLEKEFSALYGEELVPQLWKLFEGEHLRFRQKLGDLCAKLFRENYIGKLARWCEENGLAFTGHLAGEDGLCVSAKLTGGTIAPYRAMQIPGIDFLGKRLTSPVLLKQIQTARNQFGKKLLLSETFGCCGWNTTFSDYAWIWGYQAAFGLNMPCLHIGAYSISGCRKRDYPAFFSYHEPWWECFHALNEWMENADRLLSEVRPQSDVLIVSPLNEIFARPWYDHVSRHVSNQFRILVGALVENQISFDLGDETVMRENASVENGQMLVGEGKYSTVILPDTKSVGQTTLRLLQRFVAQGGTLVFTNRIPLWQEYEQKADFSFASGCEIVMNRTDLWGKYFHNSGYRRSVKITSYKERILAKELVIYSGENDNGESVCFVVNTSTESEKEVLVCFPRAGTIYEYDLQTKKRQPLITVVNEEGCYARVSLPVKNARCYMLGEKAEADDLVLCSARAVRPEKVVLIDLNSLTVDTASYRLDDKDFSPPLPLVRLQEKIYEEVNAQQKSARVQVRYTFALAYIPYDLSVWIEDHPDQKITVNGTAVTKKGEWWLDKEIHGYEIASLARLGENEVIIENEVRAHDVGFNVEEVFETEKNRFYYPVEFENIYVRGSFGVQYTGKIERQPEYYSLSDGVFCVVEPRENYSCRELTAQDLWFYRGTVCLSFTIAKRTKSVKILLKGLCAAAVSIYVADKCKRTFIFTEKSIEIGDLLKAGENAVELVLYSSNRNLLGPHHHVKGEVDFVGVNTFKGVKGYEDSIFNPCLPDNTFTENYSFVPFGIDSIVLEEWDD